MDCATGRPVAAGSALSALRAVAQLLHERAHHALAPGVCFPLDDSITHPLVQPEILREQHADRESRLRAALAERESFDVAQHGGRDSPACLRPTPARRRPFAW